MTWTGDTATGTDIVQVLRDLRPEIDLVGPIPYVQMQSMLDDPPGLRQYWSADYHDTMPDEALEVFLAAGASRPSPLTQHLMLPWGGAVADGLRHRHTVDPAERRLGHPPVRDLGKRRRTMR